MRHNRPSPEHNEYGKHIELNDFRERVRQEQRQVEELMERGFFWEEAIKLVQLHEHLYENAEVRQRMEDDEYMQFARWLYKQGAINEGEHE
ncbi:MAG TPA: hypothetical protein VKV19_03685 [Ktedonobacteraceae bacterium]|nr:hypothetical protein [Ktedonobacteraceae bacterium]